VGDVDLPLGRRPGFAVVDVETTGFDPDADRIVEVGVVVLDPAGREVGCFRTLVDPGRDPGPTHVHGISGSMVAGAPTFASIRPALAGLLSGRVVVGHNVDRFDLAFLRAECHHAGGEGLVPGPHPTVDTLRVAQGHLALAGRATLADCCSHYGLSWEDHHSALGDARVTAALFRSVRAHLGDGFLGVDQALVRARCAVWPRGCAAPPGVRDRALVG
jgi:DNA polymerase III epsilon subunit-like protein